MSCRCDNECLIDLPEVTDLSLKFREISSPLSEYSFANIFLFRKTHNYRCCRGEEFSFIRGKTYDDACFLMPLTQLTELPSDQITQMLEELRADEWIYPIPESWLPLFPEERCETVFREEDSDYLYETEKMASMSGRNLHKKRNLIKQFREGYSWQLRNLHECDHEQIISLLDVWQSQLGVPQDETDYQACHDAVKLAEKIGLEGLVAFIEETPGIWEPAGFLVYEDLPGDARVVHFAKGRKEVKGLYPFLFQELAKITEARWINLEQDLGIEALRRNKESYLPHHKERKYRVRLAAR